MPVSLFIVPYDNFSLPIKGVARRPAAARIVPVIPAVPGPTDPVCSEAETLGNHCLVKVRAPVAVLDQFRAESDFVEIPFNGQGSVTAGVRAAIRTKLQALGFNLAELQDAGYGRLELLRLICSLAHPVTTNANGDGFEWNTGARRTGPVSLAALDAAVPDA